LWAQIFLYSECQAEATPTEWAAFESGLCDRNHPWDIKLPTVVGTWRRVRAKVIFYRNFPHKVCRMIRMTNAVECLNAS